MTNDKPKREDAPIAWRVSDEELANLTFKMSDPIALFKLAENLELDLQDERKRSKRLAKANAELIEERDHARTALATLGIENDALREREKECEACGGTGKAGQYPPVGHSRMELTCPHCHEGKTLRRESEEG